MFGEDCATLLIENISKNSLWINILKDNGVSVEGANFLHYYQDWRREKTAIILCHRKNCLTKKSVILHRDLWATVIL